MLVGAACKIGRLPMLALYHGWDALVARGIIARFSWGPGFPGLGVYLHTLARRSGRSPGLISVAAQPRRIRTL
jgi:hypothetical protein